MSALTHQPDCARLRHAPVRRVRCSCGSDPRDTATPEHCPACGGDLLALTAWQAPVVCDGFSVIVSTCSAEDCRAQVEALGRAAIARGEGVQGP